MYHLVFTIFCRCSFRFAFEIILFTVFSTYNNMDNENVVLILYEMLKTYR